LQVAERLTEPFNGRVYFAPLADISDPSLIAGALLDALRVPRSPSREPLEQAVEALAKQPSLVVLDNFEQLVESGGPELVQTLLSRVPTLTLLVTSRHLLGLSAEREFALSPLPTPTAARTPSACPPLTACACSLTGRSRSSPTSR
jgi:predicted ATPase